MTQNTRFDPAVLGSGAQGEDRRVALDVMAAALAAVEPGEAVRRHVHRQGSVLDVDGQRYDLDSYRRILVVGAGKASAAMAAAVEGLLGERISAGVVNVKDGYTLPLARVRLQEAGHPLPDARGLEGTEAILRLLRDLREDDLVLALLSGGGSALLTAPVEGVSLADLQETTDRLLCCGATIQELNAVRKHLSRVTGGQLARAAGRAAVISLIVSDVVGSPLDVIASGPTAPDATTFADALTVLARHGLSERVPRAVMTCLREGERGQRPETPKVGDPVFARVQNVIVASNRLAAEAALARARALGLQALLLSTYIEGEAREVGRVVAGLAREEALHGAPLQRPACLILGGETTVTVRGRGKGGRNQELALAAALALEGLTGVVVASLATDGSDGPTDAAGALADDTTLERARAAGLDPQKALAENDSYHFFAALGDLLVTGPTMTNVNDLMFVFSF
ncbi:MAG: glycerate kinase type-2 family protein [Anaerolineae bacterium]